jgi:hypothetical protein
MQLEVSVSYSSRYWGSGGKNSRIFFFEKMSRNFPRSLTMVGTFLEQESTASLSFPVKYLKSILNVVY